MTEVLFYHLERGRFETTLPGLLSKTIGRGWRAAVKCGARETVERLDEHLWTYADESFLPHSAVASEMDAEADPIWLTDGEVSGEGRDLLFLVDGAKEDAAELQSYERCVMIFDGADETAVAEARIFWKATIANGCEATYWRQSPDGRWEKQA